MRKLPLFGVQPVMSCRGVLRSIGGQGGGGVIKGVSTGPDMFAECGNIPHLKGRIRHLKEK